MASRHYTAALAAIANLEKAEKVKKEKGKNLDYLVSAVLTSTSTIAKNKKQQNELNEFALVHGFVFDRETNSYYSTPCEDVPFQMIKVDSASMSAFKTINNQMSMDDIVYTFATDGEGNKVKTGIKKRFLAKDIDISDFNRISNLDPWAEEGIPTKMILILKDMTVLI